MPSRSPARDIDAVGASSLSHSPVGHEPIVSRSCTVVCAAKDMAGATLDRAGSTEHFAPTSRWWEFTWRPNRRQEDRGPGEFVGWERPHARRRRASMGPGVRTTEGSRSSIPSTASPTTLRRRQLQRDLERRHGGRQPPSAGLGGRGPGGCFPRRPSRSSSCPPRKPVQVRSAQFSTVESLERHPHGPSYRGQCVDRSTHSGRRLPRGPREQE